MLLDDKTALVTGAGRGIGQACAVALANAGADVIINDKPGSGGLETTANLVESAGGHCHRVEADVFERLGREKVASFADEIMDKLDIFVHVPALNIRAPFLKLDIDDFEAVITGTLTSAFHMGQLVAHRMSQGDHNGKIVFISSVHAEMPFAKSIAYGAAKAGLNHMARTMSVELAPNRINVNTIEAGWIDTPAERERTSSAELSANSKKLPLGRLGRPSEIADAVLYLVSGASKYVTGSTIVVDGGFRFKDCNDGAQ